MNEEELLDFCERWLAAWSGEDLETLVGFYSEDAFYSDPARREGLRGHGEIRPYFERLLAFFRGWRWEAVEVFPTRRGFILKWRATIPVGGEEVVEYGLDIVELEEGKITRNEVYFDRSKLLSLLDKQRRQGKQ